jgi:hypothetical protein
MSKQAGDDQPKSKTPAIADATYSDSAAVLQVGSVYRGEVSARNVNGTYNLTVSQPRTIVRNAVLALPVFGGLMGFNVNSRLAAGTSVEFSYGNPSFIHATLPEGNMDWLNARNRSGLWGEGMTALEGGEDVEHFASTPVDMVEGEFEISNLFGVAMQFLFTLMRMSAGDRAAVECHLINDMVRVVSQQYRHFSGIGEDLIFDHGRPTFERTWSSYRHELANKMEDGEPLGEMDIDQVDHKSLDSRQRWEDIGRYRFLEFVGFAGDFIHSFISDPPDAINKLAASPNYSGKSWIHRNSDGSMLMQSVADIRLERVVRIPVPKRIKHHEDPELTKKRKYRSLPNTDVLKLPELAKTDTYQLAYHLRSYSRWLSQVHSFARFHQLEDEYEVPAETRIPDPDWTNKEKDKEEQAGPMQYFDSYACITIVRDGSILLHDGYSATVAMSNGNLQLSAPRHIDIEAAGDIRMIAGRNFYVKARRNVEITARIGGMILTSYAWFKTICREGTMWLRSDADLENPGKALEDGPDPEIKDGHGVMIESTLGKTIVRSDKRITMQVDGVGDTGLSETKHDIELNTLTGNVRHFGNNVQARASEKLIGVGRQASALKSPCLYGNVGEIDLGYGFCVKYGMVFTKMLKSLFTFTNYAFNKKMGPIFDPDKIPKFPVGLHYNHTLELEDPVELEVGDFEKGIEARAEAEATAKFKSNTNLDYKTRAEGPKWEFPPVTEYKWDNLAAPHVQTLTQQAIQLNELDEMPTLGDAEWDTWDLTQFTVKPGMRIGPQNVGFGKDLEWYTTSTPGGNNLRKASDKPAKTFQIDWKLTKPILRYLKK